MNRLIIILLALAATASAQYTPVSGGSFSTSGTYPRVGVGSVVDGSNNVVASGSNGGLVFADPIALVPLVLYSPMHLPGSIAPSNMYQDAACTVPCVNANDPVKGLRDGRTGVITFTNASSTATLRFVNGYPVIHFPGGSNSYLKWGSAGSPLNLSLVNSTICARYQIQAGQANGSFGVPGVLAISGTNDRDDTAALPAGSGLAWFLDQPNSNTAPYVWKQTGMATSALTLTGSTANTYVEGLNVGTITATGAVQQGTGGAYMVLGCRVVFGVTDFSICDIEGVFVGNNLTSSNLTALSSYLSIPPTQTVICSGDSITQGVFSTGVLAGQPFPSVLKVAHPTWRVLNNGYFGTTLNTNGAATAPAASNEAPMLAGVAGTVNILWTTNDLAANFGPSQSATAIWGRCDTIYNGCGAHIFVDTILPRDTIGLTGTFEAAREAENILLVSATAQAAHHYTVIDTGAAQGKGTIGWDGVTGSNPSDSTTYFLSDKTHLNSAGCVVLETLVNNGITATLNGSTVQVTGTGGIVLSNTSTLTISTSGTLGSNAFTNTSFAAITGTGSASINLGSLISGTMSETVISTPGAALTDDVIVGPPLNPPAFINWNGYVSTSGSTTLRITTIGVVSGTAQTWNVQDIKHP